MGFSMVSRSVSWCYSNPKSWDVLGHCPACCRWHIDSAHCAAVCDQSPISAQTHSPQRSQSSGTSKLKTLPKPRASFWTQQLSSFHSHFLNFWDACQLSHSTSWVIEFIEFHRITFISGILTHHVSSFYFKEKGACRSSLPGCLSAGQGVCPCLDCLSKE